MIPVIWRKFFCNSVFGGQVFEFDEETRPPSSIEPFENSPLNSLFLAPASKLLGNVPEEDAVWDRYCSGLKHGDLGEVEGFEDHVIITPITDALVDSIVSDPNTVLVEEAAEAMGEFEDFPRLAGCDLDYERVLESRLEAALCTLDGEPWKQGPYPGADARIFQWINARAAWRRAHKERHLSQIPWITNVRVWILKGVSFMGLAVHQIDAPGFEMIHGILAVEKLRGFHFSKWVDTANANAIGWRGIIFAFIYPKTRWPSK